MDNEQAFQDEASVFVVVVLALACVIFAATDRLMEALRHSSRTKEAFRSSASCELPGICNHLESVDTIIGPESNIYPAAKWQLPTPYERYSQETALMHHVWRKREIHNTVKRIKGNKRVKITTSWEIIEELNAVPEAEGLSMDKIEGLENGGHPVGRRSACHAEVLDDQASDFTGHAVWMSKNQRKKQSGADNTDGRTHPAFV